MTTITRTVVELTADEYRALGFAAEMLRDQADEMEHRGLGGLAGAVRREAATLQRLHDRWHRARTLDAEGTPHDGCGYCEGGR